MAAHVYWRLLITSCDEGSGNKTPVIAEWKLYQSNGTQIPTTGGTASASSIYAAPFAAMYAFEADNSTYWNGGNNNPSVGTPEWLQYQFPSAVDVDHFTITTRPSGSYGPVKFSIQYSDNGSTWTTKWTYQGGPGWDVSGTFTQTYYTTGIVYRWSVSAVQGGSGFSATIADLKLYDASSTQISTATGTALGSSVWGAANSMAAAAFAGSCSSMWRSAYALVTQSPAYLSFHFPTVVNVSTFTFRSTVASPSGGLNESPSAFILEKSTDGLNWTTLQTYGPGTWATNCQSQTFGSLAAASVSISPAVGVQSRTYTVTVTGTATNFVAGVTTVGLSGSGATVSAVSVASSTSLTFSLALSGSATLGARTVTVTTGSEAPTSTFTVLPEAENNLAWHQLRHGANGRAGYGDYGQSTNGLGAPPYLATWDADGVLVPSTVSASTAGSGGTVTSVAATVPSDFAVSVTNPTTTPAIAITGGPTKAAIQQASYIYGADTGAANTYAVSLTPAPTIGAGSLVLLNVTNANTGASTLAVNGGTARAIRKNGSTALVSGDLTAGQIYLLSYDAANSWWQLLGGVGSSSSSSSSSSGGGGAYVALAKYDATSVAELDIVSRNLTGSGAIFQSDYDEYVIDLVNIVPASANVTLQLQCSTDGGATYDSGANYAGVLAYLNGSTVGNAGASNQSGTSLALFDAAGSSASYGICGSITVRSPLSTSLYKNFSDGSFSCVENSGTFSARVVGGAYKSATAVTGFRIKFSSGSIASGSLQVRAAAKTGSSGGSGSYAGPPVTQLTFNASGAALWGGSTYYASNEGFASFKHLKIRLCLKRSSTSQTFRVALSADAVKGYSFAPQSDGNLVWYYSASLVSDTVVAAASSSGTNIAGYNWVEMEISALAASVNRLSAWKDGYLLTNAGNSISLTTQTRTDMDLTTGTFKVYVLIDSPSNIIAAYVENVDGSVTGGSAASSYPGPMDAVPSSPSVWDDEFNGSSLDAKWSTPGSVTDAEARTGAGVSYGVNATGFASCLSARVNSATQSFVTKQSFAPGAAFTCTFKWFAQSVQNYHGAYVFFCDSADSNAVRVQTEWNGLSGSQQGVSMTAGFSTKDSGSWTYGRANWLVPTGQIYMHVSYNGSGSWNIWFSKDGGAWVQVATNYSKTFTLHHIYISIGLNGGTSYDMRFSLDWIRFNWLTLP